MLVVEIVCKICTRQLNEKERDLIPNEFTKIYKFRIVKNYLAFETSRYIAQTRNRNFKREAKRTYIWFW